MITEDYVSFETAKLLKEKGFDENCSRSYVKDKLAVSQGFNNSYYTTMYSDGCYRPISAPTLQMAMKWLRETHSLEIYPYHDYTEGNEKWWFEVIRFRSSYAEHESDSIYLKYEEACKAAIKYCLENLI